MFHGEFALEIVEKGWKIVSVVSVHQAQILQNNHYGLSRLGQSSLLTFPSFNIFTSRILKDKWRKRFSRRVLNSQTYPADCRKIAAVDSHISVGIERKENINKKGFLYKNIFKCDLILCHSVIKHIPVSQWEAKGSCINTNEHYR